MKSLVILLVMLFASPCLGQYPYQLDTRSSPYVRYGSRYDANPPKLYSAGRYLGELSADRFAPDSVSNRYGRYGSRYSADSINNPYGPYGRYSAQTIYVHPSWRLRREQ